MITGLSPTEAKLPDGPPPRTAADSSGDHFTAILGPLSPTQPPSQPDGEPAEAVQIVTSEGNAAQDNDTGLPADAVFAQTTQLPLEQLQPGATPPPIGHSSPRAEQTQANDEFSAAANGNPETGSGNRLPPAGNLLQPAIAELAGHAASDSATPTSGEGWEPPGSAPLQTAAQPAAAFGPIPHTLAAQPTDGQMPTSTFSTGAGAQASLSAAAISADSRGPLPATDIPQSAEISAAMQAEGLSSGSSAPGQAASSTPGTPSALSPLAASIAQSAAFTGAEAGVAPASPAGSETAGRVAQDSAAAGRTLQLPMQQFAGQPGWGEEVRANLQWLSRQGLHRAELQLHPAELGSIDVRITTENDQASVMFFAANRTARELLEAELPRLRELFSQVGVELSQADVAERREDGSGFGAKEHGYDEGHNSGVKESVTSADNRNDAVGSHALDTSRAQNLIDYYI